MSGRQFLILVNCALFLSFLDIAVAQQNLRSGNHATPSNERVLQRRILEGVLNSVLSSQRLTVPDFSFTQDIPIVGSVAVPVTFSASNIECYDVKVDDLDVSIDPTGILAADFNINSGMRFECGLDYSIEGQLVLSNRGSVILTSQDNTLELVASASFLPPSLSFPTCNFDLGTSELDFSGSPASDILDALQDIIVSTLDGALQNMDMCGDMTSTLDESEEELMVGFAQVAAGRP